MGASPKPIGSDKVEGTMVSGVDGQGIGLIERDTRSGQFSHAVLGSEALLASAMTVNPLSWRSLKYDTELGGCRAGITASQLQSAPKYGTSEGWDRQGAARGPAVNIYYGVIPT